jgi:hypothetical protein
MPAEDPKEPAPPEAAAARNKLVGRLILIFFGLLLLIYFVPLAWSFIRPR